MCLCYEWSRIEVTGLVRTFLRTEAFEFSVASHGLEPSSDVPSGLGKSLQGDYGHDGNYDKTQIAKAARKTDSIRPARATWTIPRDLALLKGDTEMAQPENYSVRTLATCEGHDFGISDPLLVDQDMINGFADVTGDQQWIHVDTKKAAEHGPFGGTIAHGFLTLSLLAAATESAGVVPSDAHAVLNYGLGKVRFLAPVPSGSTVRAQFKLVRVEDKGPGNQLIQLEATLQADGSDKPAVIAELLAMVIG